MRRYGLFFLLVVSLSGLVFSQSSRVRLATLEQAGATTANVLGWSGTAWSPTAVDNARLASMGAFTTKCNFTASSATPTDCTGSQITTLLNSVTGSVRGLMTTALFNKLARYEAAETTLASAASTDLASVTSQSVQITGTTTIAGFGASNAGRLFFLRFASALTITYNATSLIVPGAASIVTAAGDHAVVLSLGSGNNLVYSYSRASGQALIAPSVFSSSVAGIVPASGGGTTNFLRADGTWAAPIGGSGSVTNVSVVTANGFAGTVATSSSTPAITLTTTASGVLKGSSSALVAATSGTDFAPGTSANATGLVLSTTSTGALTAYGGAACINQFIRSLNPSAAATCATVSLTTDVTGVLTSTNGGLGTSATPTAGSVLYGTGSATAYTAQGTSNQVLVSNANFPPTWSSAFATLASPAFTGAPTAPTQLTGDNSTKLATTAYVDSSLAAKAPLSSPAFTGSPTAPTQLQGDNSTKLATTAYVDTGLALKAPLASPALTGAPTAPTQTAADNSTKIATTAYVDTLGASKANIANPTFTGGVTSPGYTSTAAIGAADLAIRNAGTARWIFSKSGSETGSNAGSDLVLQRYDDAGSLIATPLTITRSTGVLNVATASPGNNSTQIATTAYADAGLASKLSATITSPATTQFIRYNGSIWVNAAIALATDVSGILPSTSFPALTGDITTSSGAIATTIAANAVTNAKAAQMAANTLKGNNTGSTANASDLSVTQVRTMLNVKAKITTSVDVCVDGSCDYTTVASAITYVNGLTLSSTNRAAIKVIGTITENITLPRWVVLQGNGWLQSTVLGTVTLPDGAALQHIRIEQTSGAAAIIVNGDGSSGEVAWVDDTYGKADFSQDASTVVLSFQGTNANSTLYSNKSYFYSRNTNAGTNTKTVAIQYESSALGYIELRDPIIKTRPPTSSTDKAYVVRQLSTVITDATNGSVAVMNPTWNDLYTNSSIWAENLSSNAGAVTFSGNLGIYAYPSTNNHLARFVGVYTYNGQTHLSIIPGFAPTAAGQIGYDSTSNTLEAGVNGVNKTIAMTDSNITGTAANLTSMTLNSILCAPGSTTSTFCTGTQATSLLDNATSSLKGLMSNTDKAKLDKYEAAEATVASATTTDIGAASSWSVAISGTTPITRFGTVASGTLRFVRFTGALTLTHNATSLILPGTANITTAANDSLTALSLGSGNWLVYEYQKANGTSVKTVSLTTDVTGTLQAAQFPALTGQVTTTAGSLATTIAANTVTNANRAQMATLTMKGNNTGSTANEADLTVAQVQTMITPLLSKSTTAASAAINTTATYVSPTTFSIPANSLAVGDSFRMTLYGTNTSSAATSNTWTPRMGSAGTTADTALNVLQITSATTGTAVPFQIIFYFSVRAIGASGSIFSYATMLNQNASGISPTTETINTGAATTVSTTGTLILGCSFQAAAATSTTTFQHVVIEKIR